MTPFWRVPRMWDGQTVIILASGPSMSADVAETAMLSEARVITINNTVRLAPWANMLVGGDVEWWESNIKQWRAFLGLRVTAAWTNLYSEILRLRITGREGFDPDPSCVRTGNNSGYVACHVAAHAGAKRILLCGFDMHGGHWHDPHKEPMRDHGEDIYPNWIRLFGTLAPELAKRGIEVLNCTPGSALKCFPFADLREAISQKKEVAHG